VRKLTPACLLPLLAGCLGGGPRPEGRHAVALPASPPGAVAFVANGSGDFRTVSAGLAQAAAEAATPLEIETFVWSHGWGRYATDHVCHANHLAQGRRLAAEVAAYRRDHPERRVSLVGHSAGCAVVLAAAELLPPDGVDRLVLLAPSVCVTYDLRPALCAARGGIDSFHSGEDRLILGLAIDVVGTAEGCCWEAAGRYGFTPVIACPADAALYGRLRQHPWSPDVAWSGHAGGHYGNNRPGFLRAYVLPLLVGD
jgi:pimeloyl-ACP methyl ester carboxylesterase